jgi:hypothetical protein
MVRCTRVVAVVGALLATCGIGRAQTTPPKVVAAEPSLEYQDRLPPGWVSGGDPVGIPGEEGEIQDPRFYPPPGWFANLDVGVIQPHIGQNINGDVPNMLTGGTDRVQLPTAHLSWTATPRIGLGYRFANAGELLLTYQSVLASGTTVLPDFGGSPACLHSRLNLNVATFDWVSLENSFGPHWSMKWRGGIALAQCYFDNTASGFVVDQRTSEAFLVGGVHAGLDLWRALPAPGWALFCRLDSMYMVGGVRQKAAETIVTPGGAVSTGVTNNAYIPTVNAYSKQITPITFATEAGVSYTPPDLGHWLRLTAAYHFERWWALGNPIAQVGGSDAGFTFSGLFLRCEITY